MHGALPQSPLCQPLRLHGSTAAEHTAAVDAAAAAADLLPISRLIHRRRRDTSRSISSAAGTTSDDAGDEEDDDDDGSGSPSHVSSPLPPLVLGCALCWVVWRGVIRVLACAGDFSHLILSLPQILAA